MKTFDAFETTLETRFHGVIGHGMHENGCGACLLECAHHTLGHEWSDAPNLWPDLRPLNDGPWDTDRARTTHLVPVLRAYWDWSTWMHARQRQVMERVILLTVQRVIAGLPGLTPAQRDGCRGVTSLVDARAWCWAVSGEILGLAGEATEAAGDACQEATDSLSHAATLSVNTALVQQRVVTRGRVSESVAYAASYAAWAAVEREQEAVLIAACALWIEATQEGQP